MHQEKENRRSGGDGAHYLRWHPFWNLDALNKVHGSRLPDVRLSHQSKRGEYPIRMLRYWFMSHLIYKEFSDQGRPLGICEVGVGNGSMLAYIKTGEGQNTSQSLPSPAIRWDAVSLNMDVSRLTTLGYSHCLEKDIEESDLLLGQQYDLIILLHVLEHLDNPEAALAKLLPFVKEGGMIIGGHPGLPLALCGYQERRIRRTAQRNGHVSVFSPRRVTRIAHSNGLDVEMLTGAYLVRKTGNFLENYSWWCRLNLVFGALFPACGGELYWAIRKPGRGLAGFTPPALPSNGIPGRGQV